MCLEVKGMGEGAAVVTAPNKTENAGRQIWYSDLLMGTIRNQMTNLCMDLDGEESRVKLSFSHAGLSDPMLF